MQKKEAIENILDMVELKKEGVIRKIVVTGCLAERYRDEVLSEIPEVDAVVGIGSNSDICEVCEKVCGGEENIKNPSAKKTCLPLDGKRMLTTPSYYAYIKIGEGVLKQLHLLCNTVNSRKIQKPHAGEHFGRG